MSTRILVGDCHEVLRTLPDDSVQDMRRSMIIHNFPQAYGHRNYR